MNQIPYVGTLSYSLHLVASPEPAAGSALSAVTCLNASSQTRETYHDALDPLSQCVDPHFCGNWKISMWDVVLSKSNLLILTGSMLLALDNWHIIMQNSGIDVTHTLMLLSTARLSP